MIDFTTDEFSELYFSFCDVKTGEPNSEDEDFFFGSMLNLYNKDKSDDKEHNIINSDDIVLTGISFINEINDFALYVLDFIFYCGTVFGTGIDENGNRCFVWSDCKITEKDLFDICERYIEAYYKKSAR